MDGLTPQQRHNNMAAIRSKDTKPEMIVRRGLWKREFRYRLNHKRLPGHPDLVLRKYRTCIFVNGCFWHGHHVQLETAQIDNGQLIIENSECCKIPKTNREFWVAKIRRNKERDKEEQKKLAVTDDALKILKSKKLIEWHKPNYIISQAVAEKTRQVPAYTKKRGLDKNKMLNMLQQVIEDAGDTGIMLNEIYEYMEVTMSSDKTVEAKKKTLTFLLSGLKAKGVIYTSGRKWKSANR